MQRRLQAMLNGVPIEESFKGPTNLPAEVQQIIANTIAAMASTQDRRVEWRKVIVDVLREIQSMNLPQVAELLVAILAILDGHPPSLSSDHPYAQVLEAIQAGIAADKLQITSTSSYVIQAVREFVTAEDWEAKRQIVEARQELLFRQEVEALFEDNIAYASSAGEQRTVDILEEHLALLHACKKLGIAKAFKQHEQEQEANLPFNAELIPRTIAALQGSPHEKMMYSQYLIEQTKKTTDEQFKALLQVIQLALFNPDYSQLGQDLRGIYRRAWDAIAANIETGNMNLHLFELIANNTLAVLGPSAEQRGKWRDNLIELHTHATAQGNSNMVFLLEAVVGLLDAGGDATGLGGGGLKGIYEQTWQRIVESLTS